MSNATRYTIKIQNARLSFPELFTAKKNDEDPTKKPKFAATFILDKTANAAEIAEIKKGIQQVLNGENKGQALGPSRVCLRDGAEKPQVDGYGAGVMFVAARTSRRPQVVGRRREPLSETDGKIYPGCYVNGIIELWWQNDPKYGKRVNASLSVVQFVKDGTAFGEGSVNVEEALDDLGDENGDDSPASEYV